MGDDRCIPGAGGERSILTGFLECLPELVVTAIGIDIALRVLGGTSTVGDYSLYTGLFHHALIHIVETEKELDEGRLARPVQAHQSHPFMLTHTEGHIPQNLFSCTRVSKAYMVKLNGLYLFQHRSPRGGRSISSLSVCGTLPGVKRFSSPPTA